MRFERQELRETADETGTVQKLAEVAAVVVEAAVAVAAGEVAVAAEVMQCVEWC